MSCTTRTTPFMISALLAMTLAASSSVDAGTIRGHCQKAVLSGDVKPAGWAGSDEATRCDLGWVVVGIENGGSGAIRAHCQKASTTEEVKAAGWAGLNEATRCDLEWAMVAIEHGASGAIRAHCQKASATGEVKAAGWAGPDEATRCDTGWAMVAIEHTPVSRRSDDLLSNLEKGVQELDRLIHNNPVSDRISDIAAQVKVPVVPGATIKSLFDSIVAAMTSPDAVIGFPLAAAILGSRDSVRAAQCRPIPSVSRAAMNSYFEAALLDSVCYSTDWGAAQNVTLQQLIVGNELRGARAITLVDAIVFRGPIDVDNCHIWAHELAHVEQYRRMGVPRFASRYTIDHWTLENEAEDKADRIDAARSSPPRPLQQGQGFVVPAGWAGSDETTRCDVGSAVVAIEHGASGAVRAHCQRTSATGEVQAAGWAARGEATWCDMGWMVVAIEHGASGAIRAHCQKTSATGEMKAAGWAGAGEGTRCDAGWAIVAIEAGPNRAIRGQCRVVIEGRR